MDYSCAVIQIITTHANLPAFGMVDNLQALKACCFLFLLNYWIAYPLGIRSCKPAYLWHGR